MAPLVITNTTSGSVSPAGGSASSYVNGPLVKRMNQGDSFRFPIGNNDGLGNKLTLSATQTGTLDWTVEYVTPNDTYDQYIAPLTYVNSKEKWNVSASAGSQAIVNINWDANSDITPLVTENGLEDLRIANYNYGTSQWEEIASSASGNNSSGTITTSSRMTIPAAGSMDVTSATVHTVKPKAKFTPSGALCGATAGIPVTFTSSGPISLNYTLTYSINSVVQSPVTVSTLPYVLPTTQAGDYELISFTYNNGAATGVVDNTIITVYDTPTTANAGASQSLCGLNTTTLDANAPSIGTGLWTIVSGNGGTVVNPTSRTSVFNGVNGEGYTLRWTISNGECESSADVSIAFPLLAEQPEEFSVYDTEVCAGSEDVVYTVPLDATVTNYIWEVSEAAVTINTTSEINSVTLDIPTSISGIITLSVKAENACNISDARTIDITVNPVAAVTLSSDDSDNVLCANNSVTFTATPASGTWTNYEFFVDDVSAQTGTTNTITLNDMVDNQSVYAVATTDKGCQVTSNEITVTINSINGLWVGLESSDWNAAGNWCSGSVPADNESIVISSQAVNDPVIEDEHEYNNFEIESSSSVTLTSGSQVTLTGDLINNGEIILDNHTGIGGLASIITQGSISGTGSARIKAELTSKRYYYLGNPLSDAKLGNYDVTNPDAWVYTYRGKYERWEAGSENYDLLDLEGVSVYYDMADATHQLDFTGSLNNGAITRNYSGNGWYLFGNPYPSFINWQLEDGAGWTRNNVSPTIWYRTKVGTEMVFVTYNRSADLGSRASLYPTGSATDAEEVLALIPPLQSVWVKATTTGSLTVNNSARSHGLPGSNLKSGSTASNDIIRIVASNNYTKDGAVIYFSERNTEAKEKGDSDKQFNSSVRIPEVYTRIGNTAIAINGLPVLSSASRTIPLSVRNRVEGEVILNFDLSLFESGHSVELEDKVTGTRTNLRATADYTYTPAVMGEVHDRFVLHINQVTTSVVDPEASSQDNGITIKGFRGRAIVNIPLQLLNTQDAVIEVYTVEGQKFSETKTSVSQTIVNLPQVDALYVIRVTVGSETKTGKVLGKAN